MDNSHSSSKKRDLSVAKALGYSLFLTVLIGAIGTLFAYVPDFQPPPILGLVTVWGLSITMGVAGFWNARRPHWMANFIVLFSLTALFLAAAIHTLGPYLSGWLWLALLTGAYLLVWVLPLLNPRLARALNDEQVHPQTWLGRHQVLIALLLAILGAVLLGIFTRERTVPINPIMLFIGTTSSIAAIGAGQYFAYQVRKSWEEQTRKATK